MSKSKSFATGIKFGLLAALVYVLCVFLKYKFFDQNIASFSMVAVGGYIVFIVIWIIAALVRRNQAGGYIDIKELFQTIFLVIIFGEIGYAIFNYIYLSYIDVSFFDRLATNTEKIQTANIKSADNAEQLKTLIQSIRDQKAPTGKTAFFVFAQSIVFDSILGIIIAFIVKRSNKFSERDLDQRMK